ncbi:hypothetical protein [Halarcobacter anaerophilus]|uniref:hypothetical protein n=1 Tax=Halarcobacter anaerophilus TaxID=877500 RepID=UPI0005C8DFFD|nr:hypothetical protein [Halarcobacter anaerophilus]
MSLFTVQTGDEKLDQAYSRMCSHVSSHESFDSFYRYFTQIVKTDDHEKLNKWLLKVLFCELKYGKSEKKHDFDLMIEALELSEPAKAEQLRQWLEQNLEKLNIKRES